MQLLIFGVICSQWVYIRIGLGNQYILGRSLLSTLGILFMILGNAFYRVLYRPHEEHASTKEKYGKPKNVLLRIEWKKWYPLKKFIAFLLWNICLFTVLISTILYFSEQKQILRHCLATSFYNHYNCYIFTYEKVCKSQISLPSSHRRCA